MNGKLLIVGTPIGNLGDMSPRAVEALRTATAILCEDTRRTLQLLNHFEITGPKLVSLHEHNEQARINQVIEKLGLGETLALVSDAGMPLISDPGARLVPAVIEAGFTIEVIDGPTALAHALVLSGFDTDRFVFEGFLPASGRERRQRLAELDVEMRTVILYESPHRILKTLANLAEVDPLRKIAVTRELTKLHEEVWRGTLAEAVKAITEPRGEYTLVLEGATAPDEVEISDQIIIEAIQAEVAMGKSKRDAVATVARSFKLPRDRVYKLSIGL